MLDPFCGTGSIGIAAAALGRRYAGIDMNATHVANARFRYESQARDGFAELRERYSEYKERYIGTGSGLIEQITRSDTYEESEGA